ncbi:MAG: protoheme IX farnesyltransferase [Ignavibacteria bacterium]
MIGENTYNSFFASLRIISLTERISILLELIKIRITILVVLTTVLGYLLSAQSFELNFIFVTLGIFLLACGASVLNHFQERESDLLMNRTKRRPIPAQKVQAKTVFVIALAFILIGSFVLILLVNLEAFGIGFITLIWYNFVYTPLKKRTIWAIVPGSFVGALPPLAGYFANQEVTPGWQIIVVATYLFIWQIPHFWILLLKYGKDYKRANFPVITDYYSSHTIKYVSAILSVLSILLASVASLFLLDFMALLIVLYITASLAIYVITNFLKKELSEKSLTICFITINFFTLIFILLVSLDKILGKI